MEKVIEVTKNFRIVNDQDQYRIQRFTLVDPRNSPRNKNKVFDESEIEIREEWRDEGYYSLTDAGLQAAIKSIVIKESGMSGKEKLSLGEYLKEIKDIAKNINEMINKSMGT